MEGTSKIPNVTAWNRAGNRVIKDVCVFKFIFTYFDYICSLPPFTLATSQHDELANVLHRDLPTNGDHNILNR